MTRLEPSPEVWGQPIGTAREFAMLAHDIKGALNGVIGGIALIDAAEVDPEVRLQMERVSAAAQALASLVSDTIGDVPDGGADAAAAIDVPAFLAFLSRRWSGEARAKGLRFALEAGDGLPARLRLDGTGLSRVLGNLIGNAIKFADSGTVRLAVRRESAGGIAFVLNDDGPGLEAIDASRAFDYGARARGATKPGNGIGLHIAKSLTERMGGAITLANRSGGGAEAVVSFPGRFCDDSPGKAAPEHDEGPPDLTGLRILLAEDNLTNQMVATQMLRSMGAEVTAARDGVEALERFEETEVNFVIVDIEMPRLSGLEVIRAIRARTDARARVPIVALTAYAMQEHRERIADAGADGLIAKPIVSIDAFGRAVRAHARPRQAAEAPADEAAATAAAAAEPLIDQAIYDALHQTIGGEMMAELLDRVVADLETARQDLAGAIEPLDLGIIRSKSHILISVAGAVGAARLERRARELNHAAHGGAGPELADEVRVCLQEIAAAVGFVRDQRAGGSGVDER